MRYHIEKNTVQETLVIPLYGRKVCSERYPELFSDPEAERLCGMLDYDFSGRAAKMESTAGLFGALEVAQRQYDLIWEVRDYLKAHPEAAVVNLGCGLDDSFRKADNGLCHGYHLDLPDVIAVRDALLPAGEREENIACDMTDFSWMEHVDGSRGAVFFASGVFYYLKTGTVRALLSELARRFPDGVAVFDACNRLGAKMMTKTWLKEAGIQDAGVYFSLENPDIIKTWSGDFASVTSRSYMRGYRDIYASVRPLYRTMIRFCDHAVKMRIVRVAFGKNT